MEEIKVTHPLELALGGLGQAASLPGAPAPGRPWAPAWTPQAPGACPLTGQEKVLTLSLLEGSLIKVEASPVSPDLFIEISRLPTRVQRKGALGASFYDLPGIQSVAMSQGYRIEYAPEVQALIDKWNLWCLDLEQVKTFSDVSGFMVPGLDVEFMPFQARGVAYGCKIKSFMLLDTMGLGKSIQVLGILYTHRLSLGGRLETLILSPTSVVGDWQAKFRKFAKIEVSVATGSKAQRAKVYQGKPEFLLMSYDVFMRDMVEVAKSFRPKALICDECQRISNRKNKSAIKLFDFVDAARPQYRIMASGSPIANKPMDLWSLLRLVNADLAGSPTLFEKRYAREKLIYHKDKATGEVKPIGTTYGSGDKAKFVPRKKFENLNPNKPADAILLRELRAKISPWLIRRLKKDVLTDLPETTEETISIDLGPRERKVYEELQARFAEAMAGVADEDSEDRVDNFFTWFIRAQQVCCSLEIGGHGKESSKIDELRKFVEDYSEEQKILIFSRFKGMTDIVHREMKEYNPAYLHGAVAQADRQPLVDRFQTEDDCRLFISTLGAGGVGLTLTAGSIVARLDRWVSPILNDQCVARADRIGQKRNVLVVDFVVRDSVEERILGILEGKSRMINSLIVSEQSEERQEKKILRALGKQGMLKLI